MTAPHSKRMVLVTAVLSAGMCPAAQAQAILFDDFDDGEANGWNCVSRLEILEGADLYDANCHPASGALHLATELPVPAGELEVVGAEWLPSFDPQNFPQYSDGFFRARVRAGNAKTYVALVMRKSEPSAACFGQCYVFSAHASSGHLGILAADDCLGFGPTLASTGDVGFRAGQEWILEAGAVGFELSLRAWPFNPNDPNAPGPTDPQLLTIDFAYPVGGINLGAVHVPSAAAGPISGWFDDVSFTPSCPGDVNFNHAVELEDLAILLSHFGATCDPEPCGYTAGDLDGDGQVSLADLAVLLANFGSDCL